MKIEIWSLDRIRPYEKNARKIPKRAVDKVAVRSPCSNSAGSSRSWWTRRGSSWSGMFDGWRRSSFGWSEAPVTVARLTQAHIKAYRLMDNRSHEEATWDLELLAPELADLRALDFDLGLTGFDVHELDTFLRDPMDEEKANQAPPLPDVAVTRPGDLWLCAGRTSRRRRPSSSWKNCNESNSPRIKASRNGT